MLRTNKIYIVTVACLLVLLASTVAATNYMNNTDVWLTVPKSEASYIIGQYNSTFYYAQNATGYGTTANMGYEFLSSNASYVINSAIQKSTNGGKIFLKTGTYSITAPILAKNYITIEGENENSTVLVPTTAMNSKNVIQNDAVNDLWDFQVIHITIYGNSRGGVTNNNGIVLYHGCYVLIEHCTFLNLTGNGILLYNQSVLHPALNQINFNRFYMCQNASIYLYRAYDTECMQNNIGWSGIHGINLNYATCAKIIGNHIWCNGWKLTGTGYAIYLVGSDRVVIDSCTIESNYYGGIRINALYCRVIASTFWRNSLASNNTGYGIYVTQYGYHTIIGNNFDTSGYTTVSLWAIFETGGTDHNIIVDNVCRGTSYGIMKAGAASYVSGCWNGSTWIGPFMLEENSGNQASCINGTWIAHGLSHTPTTVTISIQGTNPYVNATAWYFVPTVLTINATKFQISFCMNNGETYKPVAAGNAKTIFWYASYRP